MVDNQLEPAAAEADPVKQPKAIPVKGIARAVFIASGAAFVAAQLALRFPVAVRPVFFGTGIVFILAMGLFLWKSLKERRALHG